jgi:transposase-like protein
MCSGWHYRSLFSVRLPKMEVDCIYCRSKHIHKVTSRVRVGGEKVKRYQCQDCGKYFQENYITTYIKPNDYEITEVII